MRRDQKRPSVGRRLGLSSVALFAALCLVLMSTLSVLANSVSIYDNAGVLNRSRVQSAANALSSNVSIYTTSSFNGSKSSFQQTTASKVRGSNDVVMAIDTVHRWVWFAGKPFSSNQYNDAASAFSSNFNGGDYTGATVAALQSLHNASGGFMGLGGQSGSSFGSSTLCCCVGLLILLGLGAFVFSRRRRGGGGFGGGGGNGFGGLFGRRNVPPSAGYPPYNQYGQPYPPNYNQGGGMNPWAAGGLGAAAGGLVGYELGREQGERERREDDYGQGGGFDVNQGGGDFGGGDFGGNQGGGDFGGGGGDWGGGGDFGGGGGDFGGGGSDNSGGGSF